MSTEPAQVEVCERPRNPGLVLDILGKPVSKNASEASFVTELKQGSYRLAPLFKLTSGEVGAYYTVVT